MTQKYSIGIDLGTTNIVVAYSDSKYQKEIKLFKIPQIIQAGKIAELSVLPSVRFVDQFIENQPELYQLPWGHICPLIGSYAKEKAIENPFNAIASAKSWLAHPILDITQPCLPIGSIHENVKTSPVNVILEQINYVQNAWDYKHPNDAFVNQKIVITIPASFNDQAREVIHNTLIQLGVVNFQLLEEPQAAFYHWLDTHDDFSNISVDEEVRSLALVCDVGGGTTDFSIILLKILPDKIEFERVATGAHLLLGGDNMDLLLSHYLQNKYQINLSPAEQSNWMVQVSKAKEKLLANPDLESIDVTLLASGSQLFKKTQKYPVTYTEVSQLILNGFVPEVSFTRAKKVMNAGLRRIGLPYEKNTAITQHLANFLIDHQQTMQEALKVDNKDAVIIPEVILFNGGVFYSEVIKDKVTHNLNQWQQADIEVLTNDTPSTAVAKGAVYYAQALQGKGIKIKSGAPSNYFLRVGKSQYICILQKGMHAEESMNVQQKFLLKVGQTVVFELFTSKELNVDIGDVLTSNNRLTKLSDIVLNIEADQDKSVRLNVIYSEIGLIQIKAIDELDNIFPLNFSTKPKLAKIQTGNKVLGLSKPLLRQVGQVIENYFNYERSVKPLKEQLEKLLGQSHTWNILTLRVLSDQIFPYYRKARQSLLKEKTWWNLFGFCLRPGYGDSQDRFRIDQLWQKYSHNVQYKNQQNWSEFWVVWRRIAPGLSVTMQTQIFDDIKAIFYTRKDQLSQQKRLALVEKMRLLASLEKISIAKKIDIGNFLIKQLRKKPEDSLLWWMLGRVGNRSMYSITADIVPIAIVESWLDTLLTFKVSKRFQEISFRSIALMIQITQDPLVDISKAKFEEILSKLYKHKVSKNILNFIMDNKQEKNEMYAYAMGESLPIGLTLLN